MKRYMLMRGRTTTITLLIKKPNSEKIKKIKLKPSYLSKNDALLRWSKVIEIENYKEELEELLTRKLKEYVARKYKKYEFVGWENFDFEENNVAMESLPVNECLGYMTAEQFVAQFGPIGRIK